MDIRRAQDRAFAFWIVRVSLNSRRGLLRLSDSTIETAMDALECYPCVLQRDKSVSMDIHDFYKALEAPHVPEDDLDLALIATQARRVAEIYHDLLCWSHQSYADWRRDRIRAKIHAGDEPRWTISRAFAIVCDLVVSEIVMHDIKTTYDRPLYCKFAGLVFYPSTRLWVDDGKPFVPTNEWDFEGAGPVIISKAMEETYNKNCGWRLYDFDTPGPAFGTSPLVRVDHPFRHSRDDKSMETTETIPGDWSYAYSADPIACTGCNKVCEYAGGDNAYARALGLLPYPCPYCNQYLRGKDLVHHVEVYHIWG
eukprot:jgi/Mesvir1/1471/Mv14455-RA.1